MKLYHIFTNIYISHLYFSKRSEDDCKCKRDWETEKQGGLPYWFLLCRVAPYSYSGLHLKPLLLLGQGGRHCTFWALPGCSPCLLAARPCIRDWRLQDSPLYEVTCIYDLTESAVAIVNLCELFPLVNHLSCFHLSTHVSCLQPRIAVFLLTQLEHDGSVKGQYTTWRCLICCTCRQIWLIAYLTSIRINEMQYHHHNDPHHTRWS